LPNHKREKSHTQHQHWNQQVSRRSQFPAKPICIAMPIFLPHLTRPSLDTVLDKSIHEHDERAQAVKCSHKDKRIEVDGFPLALLPSVACRLHGSLKILTRASWNGVCVQRKRNRPQSTSPPQAGQNKKLKPVLSRCGVALYARRCFRATLCATRARMVRDRHATRALMMWIALLTSGMLLVLSLMRSEEGRGGPEYVSEAGSRTWLLVSDTAPHSSFMFDFNMCLIVIL
jgi:hypothetical protein